MISDSSDVGTGSVLVQEASDGLDHPVSYFSKKFLKYQKNYSVIGKETLGLVLALERFDVYLYWAETFFFTSEGNLRGGLGSEPF